ncbi:cAMP phosphodiesterases class-II-domain-containing protein [Aspergillus karnatakaensis]|uniref:3',5'-cyclic-nucleotide phosphodiesterase PDE1 n=1 Tax=Aspergillus karnatakaensis TaxID=1810916 RepID=UPI003CCDF11E
MSPAKKKTSARLSASKAGQPKDNASPAKEPLPEDSIPYTKEALTQKDQRSDISEESPALQIVVLGPTGGPREDRVTSLLVKSLAVDWAPNCVIAVDAGTLVCGIINVLSRTEENGSQDGIPKSGFFAGLRLPHDRDTANAAYIFQKIIGSVLITHPHIDHVSALAINTPLLERGHAPKIVTGLPSVIDALKTHVFNGVIWPNLSNEDQGAGLIAYNRLLEGGNTSMGSGQLKGYVTVCDGLLAQCLGVSHGRGAPTAELRRASSVCFPGDRSGSQSTPRSPYREQTYNTAESSAFFLRDQQTGAEVVIFGDVEADSISKEPRNRRVWEMAATRVVDRRLRAIFIECSYSDETDDDQLFGHLCPRHLIQELSVLGQLVAESKGLKFATALSTAKRKREHNSDLVSDSSLSPKTKRVSASSKAGSLAYTRRASSRGTSDEADTRDLTESGALVTVSRRPSAHRALSDFTAVNEKPLAGLPIFVIHVKETLSDGPDPREQILQELVEQGEAIGLGCEFHVPRRGETIIL